jgi:PST family polysaccharide transporter
MASTVILARLLTPDDFGIVALSISLLALLSAFTDRALASAVIRTADPSPGLYDTLWSLGMVRGASMAVCFALSSFIAAKVFSEPRLMMVMPVLAIYIFMSGLYNPRSAMLVRDLVFWQQFMIDVSQKLVNLIVTVSIAFFYKSYWAMIIGIVVGQAASTLLSYFVLPYRPRFSLSHSKEVMNFSMWLTFGKVLNMLNWRLDHLMIGGWIGRPALGVYTMGDNLAVIPTREIITPLTGVLFPAFSRFRDNPRELAQKYQLAQASITALILPAGVGMALVADSMVRLALGPKWLNAIFIIQGLAAVFAFQTLGSLAPSLAMAAGSTRNLFFRDVQSFLIRVPLICAGLYLGGVKGIVIARACTGVILVAFNLRIIKSVTGLGYIEQLKPNARSLASVCLMAVTVLVTQRFLPAPSSFWPQAINLIVSIGVGGFTYVTAMGLSWAAAGRPKGPESELLRLAQRRKTPE